MRLIISLIFFICAFSVYAGEPEEVTIVKDYKLVTVPRQVRNLLWVTPSKATTINGWSIGWAPTEIEMDNVTHINGLHTGISPVTAILGGVQGAIMAPFMVLTGHENVESIFKDYNSYSLSDNSKRLNGITVNVAELMPSYRINGIHVSALYNEVSSVNGISITGLAFNSKTTNGISINGFGQLGDTMNGLSISGLYNRNYRMNGLQIGGYNNNNLTCGLQIGLFNKTQKLKGVQIGLWNKNGKLGLPFLNVGW